MTIARLGGVVTQLAPQMADVDVDEVVVADPRVVADCLEQLTATQHHAGAGRQGVEKVEFGAGQHDRLTIEEHLRPSTSMGDVSELSRRASGADRPGVGLADSLALRGRRSIARMRATNSRGLKGLVT